MAKTLRTSGDYTITTGTGYTGSNSVIFDSKTTRVKGNLVVDGDQVIVNTETLSIEDPMIVLSRNTSSTVLDEWDSGILVNRGTSNNATLYWDGTDDVWKAMLTTSDGSGTTITETALANIRVAEPSNNSDAATKNYVDSTVSGGGFSIGFRGDDSAVVSVASGNSVLITGGTNLSTAATEEDTVTISLAQNLTDIHSITNSATNQDLTLSANSSGSVVINDILTFSGNASTPTAGSVTKIYSKAVSGGGTGIYFINSAVGSGTEDELISKKKATALAIALG
jgi:hypothetical protein